jgi:hypothetical protein
VTGKELRPWIHFDFGEIKKLKQIRFKPDVAMSQKDYFLFYSSSQRLDQKEASVSYRSQSIKVDEKGYIDLSDIEARYVKIQLNEDIPQSLVLNGISFVASCSPNPPTPEDGKCDNGGFERGDFTGWIAESGTRLDDGRINNLIQGLKPNQFEVVALPIKDPNVPISSPCSGQYVARLGQRAVAGGIVERLSYTFTVDNSNANFFFRYAFVLNDGGHPEAQQAYFEYQFYKLENGIKTKIDDLGERIVADRNNPYFTQKGDVLYKDWTCKSRDLSPYIGKTLIAEFTNADCAFNQHYAYTYIDGICTTAKDNTPVASIAGTTVVCSDPEYKYSGQTSCGGNRYTWKLGKVHYKGFLQNEVSEDFFGQPSDINISDFYKKNNFTFEFGSTYRLILIVKNDCSESTATKDIFINERKRMDYKDIVICGSYPGGVTMQPNYSTCNDCTYQWSGSWKFDNPTSFAPTLKPAYFQCGTLLRVTATDSKGCSITDDVRVFPLNANFISIDKDVDMSNLPRSQYCNYDVNVKLATECLPAELLKLRLTTDADPGYEKYGDLTRANAGDYGFNFKIPQSLGENLISSSNRIKVDLQFDKNLVHVFGDYCLSTITTLENRFWYWGYFNAQNQWRKGFLPMSHRTYSSNEYIEPSNEGGVYIPNIFSPEAKNTDNKQFKAFTRTGYGFGAFWKKAEVFYRWGNLVASIEESALLPTITLHNRPSDAPWAIWNGIIPGTRPADDLYYPSDVYTWTITMENCSTTERRIRAGDVFLAR